MSALLSLESQLAGLPAEQREAVLADIDPENLAYAWDYRARPDQLEATHSRSPLVLVLTGRGTGKTRTGCEWIREKIRTKPDGLKLRFALVARTAPDVRDTIIQGESGLYNTFPPSEQPVFIANRREVKFHDGSVGLCFTSIEPSQLRGPQFHYGLADELAAWKDDPDDSGLNAFGNMRIAVRLGDHPQIMATTTPKRTPEILKLVQEARDGKAVHLVTGATTYDNPYLSHDYKQIIFGLYEGTRLGAQEIGGQLLEDVEGALWRLENINGQRADWPGTLGSKVVGVDPSVAELPGDECGIVVVAATNVPNVLKRHAYVLADRSVLGAPSVWAQAVVDTANEFRAPVVAEANQGGALVKEVIHGIDPNVRVRLVHAKQGKKLRAEPVTLAYDQGRVHHVGRHIELEDQMTTWVPGETKDSPDRVDALVYALSALIVPSAYKAGVGQTRVKAARGLLPVGREGLAAAARR